MKITYIHHSCFLAETESACLLFDYFEGELPAIPENKPLYILASHNHHDHFSEAVFSLNHPKITYLLSWDIPAERVPEGKEVHFLQPQETWTDGCLSLETYRSTDEGVAFWCCLDGKQLYHAGDLNHWYWEGEDEDWNRDMTDSYRAEIAKMAGKKADAAFLPVDPRLEQWFYLGADDFMQQADADVIFPMHFWGDFSVCQQLRAHPCSENYRDRIVIIEEKGQSFSL